MGNFIDRDDSLGAPYTDQEFQAFVRASEQPESKLREWHKKFESEKKDGFMTLELFVEFLRNNVGTSEKDIIKYTRMLFFNSYLWNFLGYKRKSVEFAGLKDLKL